MNEVLFCKANDRIEDSADRQAPPVREPIAFYCECQAAEFVAEQLDDTGR